MNASASLTDTTLDRIRSAARGNGVNPAAITVIEANENPVTLTATLTLTPQLEIESHSTVGRIKAKKGVRLLSSFDELMTEAQSLEKDFKETGAWVDEALKELEKTDGHGWGQHDGFLVWGDETTRLAATENCPTCRGSAQHPCYDCQHLGFIHCHYCEGRGRELCTQCAGTARNPYNPEEKCPTCDGTRYSLCRFCHGQGKTPCEKCKGRGHIPCADCKGTGVQSREIAIKKGARLAFALGPTTGLPSGFLRAFSRIGEANITKGHAQVRLIPPNDEERKSTGAIALKLEAEIPYAELKLRFGKRAALVSCFGKQARLSGVPPFLDEGLSASRTALARAAKGAQPLDDALKARAVSDALELILNGKSHPNDLRRLYPIGLSGEVAQEIMLTLAKILRRSTERARQVAGGLVALASAGVFAGVFLTPLYAKLAQSLGPQGLLALKVALPLATLGAAWALLTHAARWQLKRLYPTAKIAGGYTIGKTGIAALGLIAAAYVAILLAAGMLG